MNRRKDLKGQKVNMLTAISFDHKDKWNNAVWLFECDCGKMHLARGSEVTNGNIKSCGCLVVNNTKKANIKHSLSRTKDYKVWINMKARCFNESDINFDSYGGRGITVCNRWLKFENFIYDMGRSPKGTSIERIDNNDGYSPDNCKWGTVKEQQQNKSNSYFWYVDGVKFNSMYDAARILDINTSTLAGRFNSPNFTNYTKALKYECSR